MRQLIMFFAILLPRKFSPSFNVTGEFGGLVGETPKGYPILHPPEKPPLFAALKLLEHGKIGTLMAEIWSSPSHLGGRLPVHIMGYDANRRTSDFKHQHHAAT